MLSKIWFESGTNNGYEAALVHSEMDLKLNINKFTYMDRHYKFAQ